MLGVSSPLWLPGPLPAGARVPRLGCPPRGSFCWWWSPGSRAPQIAAAGPLSGQRRPDCAVASTHTTRRAYAKVARAGAIVIISSSSSVIVVVVVAVVVV